MQPVTRARVLAAATALAVAILAPIAEAAKGSDTPPPLTLTSQGETVRATQGSFCWSSGTADGRPVFACGDYFYPLSVRCRLPAAPGDLLKVRTGAEVRVVDLALISSATDSGADYLEWDARRHSRAGRSVWRFRLPAEIEGAAAIDVVINGPRGDSNTWTGLATQACARLPR